MGLKKVKVSESMTENNPHVFSSLSVNPLLFFLQEILAEQSWKPKFPYR